MKYITNYSYNNLPKKYVLFVEKLLKDKNRRYFGVAASGLSNQLIDPKYKKFEINKKAIQVGIAGEKSTSKILRKWITDKPNAILVDSIHLPLGNEADEQEFDEDEGQVNALGDTDHLLIIGNTLIIIDSKNWKEKAGYSIAETGEILRSKKQFKGNRPKINQSKYLWKKFFDGVTVDLEAFICISNPNSIIIRDRSWWVVGVNQYKLVNQDTLVHFLDKLYNEQLKDVDYINVDLVAQAIQGIQKPYNKFEESFPVFYNLTKSKG